MFLNLGKESAKHQNELQQLKVMLESEHGTVEELTEKLRSQEAENDTLQEKHAKEMETFQQQLTEYTGSVEEQLRQLQQEAEQQAEKKYKEKEEEYEQELQALKNSHLKDVEILKEELDVVSVEKGAREEKIEKLAKSSSRAG